MECSLFKRKRNKGGKIISDRTYSGQYKTAWMSGPQRVPLGTADKGVAEKLLKRIVAVAEKGHRVIRSLDELTGMQSGSLETSLQTFVADLAAKKRSRKYQLDITSRIRAVTRFCKWNTIEDVHLAGFIRWRSQANLAPKTLNEYLAAWTAFLNWCVKTGLLETMPFARVDKVKQRGQEVRKRRAFSEDELRRLFAVAPLKRRVIYAVALCTGLRRNECKQLQWGDVHLDADPPYVIARASTTKNSKEACQILTKEAAELLREWRPENPSPNQRVFQMFKELKLFKRDLEAAGIPFVNERGEQADFHAFRKTLDTLMGVAGEGVATRMEIMRHSEARLSTHVYNHAPHLPTRQAVERLPSVLLGTRIGTRNFGSEGNVAGLIFRVGEIS